MSRLDPRTEDQNRKAFYSDLKAKDQAKKVAAWLQSRPEVGTLTRATGTAYYVYPAGGEYVEIEELSRI
jgi:hypothetical protein